MQGVVGQLWIMTSALQPVGRDAGHRGRHGAQILSCTVGVGEPREAVEPGDARCHLQALLERTVDCPRGYDLRQHTTKFELGLQASYSRT